MTREVQWYFKVGLTIDSDLWAQELDIVQWLWCDIYVVYVRSTRPLGPDGTTHFTSPALQRSLREMMTRFRLSRNHPHKIGTALHLKKFDIDQGGPGQFSNIVMLLSRMASYQGWCCKRLPPRLSFSPSRLSSMKTSTEKRTPDVYLSIIF